MEKSFEGTFATELEGTFAQRSDSVSLTGLWEYRIADKNTVEASVETWVSSLLYSRESVSYLSSAGMGENAQPYPHQPQLLVYYASPGERLWDIAKSHRALLSDLQEQNDLYEDTLPDARDEIGAYELRAASQQEIQEFGAQLARFGLSFSDVADNCPRQDRTLAACRRVLDYARANPALLEKVAETGKLPMNELALGSGTERKTLERHRKYLVAILLAFTNGYEIIRGHLCQIGPGRGGERK